MRIFDIINKYFNKHRPVKNYSDEINETEGFLINITIDWDTTDKKGSPQDIDLPRKVAIPIGLHEDKVSNYLFNKYGCRVNRWTYFDFD